MIENKKFGKGLSSLLGEKNFSILNNINEDNKNIKELDINLIITNTNQPRKKFSENELQELTESIKQYGILQPILVRKLEEKYEIIAGERRYRAARIAGLKTIPVIIKNFEDKDAFNLSIIENIQRENLNAIEEAIAYKELIEKYNYTQEDISKTIGKSRSHIANLLRLLNLPNEIQKYLIDGKIEMGHARALINCNFAMDIIEHIIDNKLSVREVENLIKDESIITDINIKNKKIITISNDIKDRINIIKSKIKLNCKLNYNKLNGKGTINIKFRNLEELDDFINKL